MRCVVQLAASQTDARGSGVGSNDILGLQAITLRNVSYVTFTARLRRLAAALART